MEEKYLKEFSDKIIAQGDGITKVEIFINGEKKWEHHAIPVTERIKTYEDACAEVGIEPMNEEVLQKLGFTKDEIAYRKLKTIAEALNEGWQPDWSNSNEYKYWPWFVYNPNSAGFGCATTASAATYTHTYIGSRLCYKTRNLATYAGLQFIKLYEKFLL